MPRVARFGGANRKGGNKPPTQAPPPLIDPPPSTQALPPSTDASSSSLASSALIDVTPSTEAPLQTPPATQTRHWRRQYTEASPQVPQSSIDAPSSSHIPPLSTNATPSTQVSIALIDTTTSTEVPLHAPPATQTRLRSRQYKEAPSPAQPPLTYALPSTQAPPTSTKAPPSTQAALRLIDATPSTEAPLQAPPAPQTRGRRRQYMEASSQASPLSTDALPSTQAPSSSKVSPPSTNVPPSTEASPSMETPSETPVVTTQPRSRQSIRYWTVDVRDASGVTKVAHLKLKDLWELPIGTKVVLPLNDCKQPVGEAAGLLGQALGQLGANFATLPICYKSWSKVPNNYKEEIYNSKIKEKFIINDALVKKMIIKRIGEKWKDNRSIIFHRYYDAKLSREENYVNHPPNIDRDQWIQFIDYRLDPNTEKMCKRNAQSREKLLVVHRGGSKTLARKRYEMEVESRQPVGRGKVFVATHANADGSYANNATQNICEKIIHVESEGTCSQAIAPNDSLGQVFGKEPPGRVRGLGLGPCKSQVFVTETQMHDAFFAQMQQEIVDLRAQLEGETKSRLEFQNAVSLILQHVATPCMTPELAAILTPMLTRAFQATRANDGDVRPSNGSSSDRS